MSPSWQPAGAGSDVGVLADRRWGSDREMLAELIPRAVKAAPGRAAPPDCALHDAWLERRP